MNNFLKILDNKLHKTVVNGEDIMRFSNINLLGSIASSNEDTEHPQDDSNISVIVNKIRFTKYNTVLIDNCNNIEENKKIIVNMAIKINNINKKVLLVLPKSESLQAKSTLDYNSLRKDIVETSQRGLYLLRSNDIYNKTGEKDRIKKAIAKLKENYDFIIFETPQAVEDAVQLAAIVDTTVLIANSGTTKIKDLISINNEILDAGGNVLGAILNKQEANDIKEKINYNKKVKNIDKKEPKQIVKKELTFDNIRTKKSKKVETPKQKATIRKRELKKIKSEIKKEIIKEIDERFNDISNNLHEDIMSKVRQENLDIELRTKQQIKSIKKQNRNEIKQLQEKMNNEIEKNKKSFIIEFEKIKEQDRAKTVYNIDEVIEYKDLEKNATYIIPVKKSSKI